MAAEAKAQDETGIQVLDLDHFARQTLGDRRLQREVLGLFAGHAAHTLHSLKAAESLREKREAAHALVGAARSIGAFDVAAKASAVENGTSDSHAGLADLQNAIDMVRLRIEQYLSE